MNLAQIDSQIAKWKELRSNISLKLVDLDEMPTYQSICRGLYRGTTAAAVADLGDAINLMWTLSALWEDAFAKLADARAHSPMPWEKEKWLHDLEAMMVRPVITISGPLELSDTLKKPTHTLGQALMELVNQYDQVTRLIRRIDAQVELTNAKVSDLSKLAESVGSNQLKSQISDIADQVQSDPLGVSLDSFAAIEARLRRFDAEVSERQSLINEMDLGESILNKVEQLLIEARKRQAECKTLSGTQTQIPPLDLSDLRTWGKTLRGRVNDAELGAIKIGLRKWSDAIQAVFEAVQSADRANQGEVDRYHELVGRFSAAQVKAASTRVKEPDADRLSVQIRAALTKMPKDLSAIEELLIAYEKLLRS